MLRKNLVLFTAGLLGAIAVATGIALAAIPDNGVITGCYTKSGGKLRIIDGTVTNCKSPETKLEWNVLGPKGDPGTNGTDGTNGTNGTNGTDGVHGKDGVSGWERVVSTGSRSPLEPSGPTRPTARPARRP